MKNLSGKNALITGSTSGIGRAIAKELARNGVNIFLNGIESIQEVTPIIEEMSIVSSASVNYIRADLSCVEDITRLCESVGEIDILINNAGIQHVDFIENFPVKQWERILALNLSAAFYTTRALISPMKRKGWGRIINIASVHGLVASAQKSAYVAAKHGLIGLTKSVALENAGNGVTCNALCPGWVLTPLVQKQIDAKMQTQNISLEQATHDLLFEKQPSLQFVRPEDFGQWVVFLCTTAADQMTGSAINIDGGWLAR